MQSDKIKTSIEALPHRALLMSAGLKKEDFDFEALSALRRLLSNEKARLLHVIKKNRPKSIYELAKILKRDFKSVNEDIKLLQRFGIA